MQQVILVVGDLLAFLFFGALGRASHELELSLRPRSGRPTFSLWAGL